MSDPCPGRVRASGGRGRDSVVKISSLAITRIELGWRGGVAVVAVLPKTGEVWKYEGDTDTIASALWRAGQAFGCRADRQTVFWALHEFYGQARRQAERKAIQ